MSDDAPTWQQGAQLLKSGNAGEAAVTLRKVIAITPTCFEAQLYLGMALTQLGQPQQGVQAFRQAVQLKPDNALAHYNLGCAQDRAGDVDGAVQSFEQALTLDPGYERAQEALNRCRSKAHTSSQQNQSPLGGAASSGVIAQPVRPPMPPSAMATAAGVISGYATAGYAGFWKRFVASFIDGLLLGIVGMIVGGIAGVVVGAILGASGVSIEDIQIVCFILGGIIGYVLRWLYFALMESSEKQATLGKMALGIVVTDLHGQRITFGQASGRFWGKIVSAVILYIGFMMAGWTEKKQALHDTMAGTLVVNRY